MKKVFLIIAIVLFSVFGISIFQEFMVHHGYYRTMLASWDNRKIIIWAIVSICIPLWYILKTKQFSLKKFFVWMLPLGLVLFSLAHTLVKESIVGGPSGFIILCINTLILYFLGMFFVVGTLALGTWISKKLISFAEIRWQEMFLNFGIGIGALLLLLYVLSMARFLYPAVVWVIALGLVGIIRYMKKDMSIYQDIVVPMFDNLKLPIIQKNSWTRIFVVLLGLTIMYYFYGFNLSFIPYSTAWDANHAYMYIPKVLAENHGVLRGNMGPAESAPYLWHMFITFRFSLIQPIKSRFWLSPDTIAVAMNFLSGMFVMFFGLGLVREVLQVFGKTNEDKKGLGMSFGWLGILLWLTSGMGAFLVFVDNKTDLGVLALTILALLSGFILIRMIAERASNTGKMDRKALSYVIISGMFFALASMSKPTAFIDIALFGLLLIGLWIDEIIAFGLGIMVVGATGILQIANAKDLMNTQLGKRIFLVGAIVVLLGLIRIRYRYGSSFFQQKSQYFKYIGVWIVSLFAILVIFKGPNILIGQIQSHQVSPSSWIKSLLLGKQEHKILLASRTSDLLDEQSKVDQEVLQNNSATISLESCLVQNYSSGELNTGLKKAVAGNEDVGRYVGYGWKEFARGRGMNLGYYLMRIMYPVNDICYGVNSDAKLLCKNTQAIEQFDVQTLRSLLAQVKAGGEVANLLSGALSSYQKKSAYISGAINPLEFRDDIVALRQYYQNHSIFAEAGKIQVPYRYIIPLNVVFNRSLQNLSSYYTDIGFFRLFMFVLLVMGCIYALIQKDKKLILLTGTTIVGWAARWVIGGGIVWYGIGLIIWTILSTMVFLQTITSDYEDKKYSYMSLYIFLSLFAIRAIIQLCFNLIRISSQGGGGPFLRYKMSNGKTVELTQQLQQQDVVVSPYTAKDVFDLQFPHYNKFMDYTYDRKDTDGVLIAGTYLQYFLKNQHNIKGDGMLGWFWEQSSDNNPCKTYRRLRENNIKYLVIDPNIGTVVMGEGNESLFHRFFAKIDPVTKKIQEHGAISRLVQLRKDGYIHMFSTNNLGAKYAFTSSDDALQTAFGPMDEDALILLRAKLAIARFFPEDSQKLIEFIATTFSQRLSNGNAIGDIADIYGKTIDENLVMQAAIVLIQNKDIQQAQDLLSNMTQDERLILAQYVGLVNLFNAQNTQYQEYLNSLLSQSLGGGSQLMVFALE